MVRGERGGAGHVRMSDNSTGHRGFVQSFSSQLLHLLSLTRVFTLFRLFVDGLFVLSFAEGMELLLTPKKVKKRSDLGPLGAKIKPQSL
jgi:hypothetical protein